MLEEYLFPFYQYSINKYPSLLRDPHRWWSLYLKWNFKKNLFFTEKKTLSHLLNQKALVFAVVFNMFYLIKSFQLTRKFHWTEEFFLHSSMMREKIWPRNLWKLYLTVLNSISPSYLQINDNLNNIEHFP